MAHLMFGVLALSVDQWLNYPPDWLAAEQNNSAKPYTK